MKVIIDLQEELYARANSLVRDGGYSDLSTFACVALENQIILEEGGQPVLPEVQKYDLLTLRVEEPLGITCVPAPEFLDINVAGYTNPAEEIMVWGQINKIFPVKFLLRYFLTFRKSEVDLEDFRNKAQEAAWLFGCYLRDLDGEAHKLRDEKLSIAFPSGTGNLARQRTQKRFGKNYIGYIRRSGIMSGALLEMRFAGIKKKGKKSFIGLTEAGLAFAKLPNPIIDGNGERALSEEEARFYTEHCRKNLSGEYAAMKEMAQMINKRQGSTDELTAMVRERMGKEDSDGVRQHNYIVTMRSGMISRMFELGFIKKSRKGYHVRYELTEFGMQFLEGWKK
jgi:hypothetical protein